MRRGVDAVEKQQLQHDLVKSGLCWLCFMAINSNARDSMLYAAEDIVSSRYGRRHGKCTASRRGRDDGSIERLCVPAGFPGHGQQGCQLACGCATWRLGRAHR